MTKKQMCKNFDIVLRFLIAAIFIYAGAVKILNPAQFAEDIDNYRMLPYFLVTLMAIILPWLEVLCGLLLIFGKWRESAAFLLMLLSFMFIIAIGSALFRGLDISCGCFVMSEEITRVSYLKLLEDIILFSAILFVYKQSINTK